MSFQDIAIAKLLKGDAELIPDLSREFFTGKNNKIYTLILESYADSNKLPTKEILQATISNRAPAAIKGPLIAMVDHICNSDTSAENDFVVKSLHDAFVLDKTDGQIEELIEAQRGRDSGKVKALLSTLLEDLSISNVAIKDLTDISEEEEELVVCPSGLGEEFDELVGGGFSGLVVVAAKSGAGKSVLRQLCAIESFRAGKNVLYLSLELSGKVLGNRIKANISGIDFSKINKGTYTAEEKAHIDKSYSDTFSGKDNVFRVTTSQVDTSELLSIIAVEKQLHNIDVVVIDYLGLISPAKSDRGESWATLATLVKNLHKATMRSNLVIVTASQINEVSKGKDGSSPVITARGSKELEFSATQFYYLEKLDGEENIATLFTMKNRLARCAHSMLDADLSTMTFTDSKIRLN